MDRENGELVTSGLDHLDKKSTETTGNGKIPENQGKQTNVLEEKPELSGIEDYFSDNFSDDAEQTELTEK